MAKTFHALTGTAGASHTTASITPVADSYIWLFAMAWDNADITSTKVSGSDSLGTAYTEVADYTFSIAYANPDIRITVYRSDSASGGSPSARTFTCAYTGALNTAAGIVSIPTADFATQDVVQSAGGESTSGDPAITFGASPAASGTFYFGCSAHGGEELVTLPSGWTKGIGARSATGGGGDVAFFAVRGAFIVYDDTPSGTGPHAFSSNNPRAIFLGMEVGGTGAAAATSLPPGLIKRRSSPQLPHW